MAFSMAIICMGVALSTYQLDLTGMILQVAIWTEPFISRKNDLHQI